MDVANLKSFSKAAKKEYISQTSISEQVSKLEKELNVKLFIRSNLPIQLTEIGNKVYQRVKTILNQYDLIKSDIKNAKQKKSIFNIEFSEGVTVIIEELIVPVVKKMSSAYLRLVETSPINIQEDILRGTADVGISYASDFSYNPLIQTKNLIQGNFQLLVGPQNSLYNKKTVFSKDLKKEKIIYIADSPYSNSFKKMQRRARKEGIKISSTSIAKNIETALLMVSLNRGVTFIPIQGKLSKKFNNLHRINIASNQYKYNICLIYKKKNKNKLLRYFLAQIR